ncbi:CueP family metal-binding protein [Fredinandcohnia sp. QZ13]|uniref:CueP family metal-binding protein n=1 Tax=Fredinandcohnia sp. QZ13 TaxID=3073144 RepID=UPI002853065F|nr:CueP family metal-binding protein [Fredinandcohnia sp. QZ13]MDR4887776.1 CueP family metal-binding protein [Fredinandcohnia sp. QZ13]
MKKGLIGIAGLLLILLLAACNNSISNEKEATEVKDIKELVHDYSIGSFEDVSASITSHELIITDSNKKETAYDLPEDEFIVSIAPFVKETHECAIHSLTGCQGELVEKEFDVHIEDEVGNVIVDETMTSFENGFIDLWLPRDKTYQVKIEYDGKTAESQISTFKGDNTCITTMQLM